MNRAPGNAQRLPCVDLDRCAVDGPGQHSANPVDRLLVMVMAMGRRHQSRSALHDQLERRDTARRIFGGDEEMDTELPQSNDFLGRIDAVLCGLLRHVRSSSDSSTHRVSVTTNSRPYRGTVSSIRALYRARPNRWILRPAC